MMFYVICITTTWIPIFSQTNYHFKSSDRCGVDTSNLQHTWSLRQDRGDNGLVFHGVHGEGEVDELTVDLQQLQTSSQLGLQLPGGDNQQCQSDEINTKKSCKSLSYYVVWHLTFTSQWFVLLQWVKNFLHKMKLCRHFLIMLFGTLRLHHNCNVYIIIYFRYY